MPPAFGVSAPPGSTFAGTGQAVTWTWAEAAAEIEAGTVAGEAIVAGEEVLAPFIAVAPEVLIPALLAAALLPSIARHFQSPPSLPPMNVPFFGGQSPGVLYRVRIEFKMPGNPPDAIEANLVGPILGLYGAPNDPPATHCYVPVFAGGAQQGGEICLAAPATAWDVIPHIVSAVRVDGQPDTGGNPSPRFPAPAQTPPFAVPKTITLPGGITLPITPTLVPYNVPSKVQPGSPTTPLAPHEEFPAPLQVRIPEIGIHINFTPGGVELVPEFEPDHTGRQSNTTGQTTPPPGSSQSDECKCTPETDDLASKLQAIKDELDAVKKCACGPEFTIQTQTLGGGTGGSFGLPANTLFVTIQLTVIPQNARKEFGAGGPDVYYAGWCSFGVPLNPCGERTPIAHQNNTFFAPENAKSFSYTVKAGYSATAVATYKQKQES